MEWIFVGLTLLAAMFALGNWRAGIHVCLILDVVRDPIRKLIERQPSIITVIVAVVWLACLIGAMNSSRAEYRLLFRRYPDFKTSLKLLVFAMLPGMLISTIRYNSGWILATIGFVSYIAPFLGIVLGYLWPRRLTDIYRWMKVYVVFNAICLIGAPLEAWDFNVPGLGGLNMVWLRNHGTDLIRLICGFYRSPDVMGLHAAHTMMFASLLATRPRQKMGWFWWTIVAWAGFSLLLCGRRKMIVIPMFFLVTYVILQAVFAGRKRVAIVMGVLACLCTASLSFVSDGILVENDYTEFASSIASEGAERAARSFTDIVVTTLKQSGWLGDGLGTVTQGRQYMGVVTHGRDWQEDGVGRLFKELGVPGVVCIVISAIHLVRVMRSAINSIPPRHPTIALQFAFCGVIVANMASFSVSHQAYSGDPSTVLIVGFCLGIILGLPRTVWSQGPRNDQTTVAQPEPVARPSLRVAFRNS